MLDPNTFWALASKRLTWSQIWELTTDRPFQCTSSALCGLNLSVLVLVLGQLKRCPARLTKNGENIAWWRHWSWKCLFKVMTFAPERVLMRIYPYPKFGVSSSSGSRAQIAAGIICPHPGRVIFRPSPARVLIYIIRTQTHEMLLLCTNAVFPHLILHFWFCVASEMMSRGSFLVISVFCQ